MRTISNGLRFWVAGILLAAWPAFAAPTSILVVGDSLSSAYGIDTSEGWVALLQGRLQQQGYRHRVTNASIAGDTTSIGRLRLPTEIQRHNPSIVIIELGGNDGLRGLAVPVIKDNLEAMIHTAKSQDIDVLLLGMRMPPNYGPAYVQAFAAMYADLAQQFAVGYVPFLLAGVASEPGMMQADGIHPTAQAQAAILDNVWPEIAHLLP